MASFEMVFCRKITLLCRQLVRRSMVFSTVQISMPGTSCAHAAADVRKNAIKIIGRIMGSLAGVVSAKRLELWSVNNRLPTPEMTHRNLIPALTFPRAFEGRTDGGNRPCIKGRTADGDA